MNNILHRCVICGIVDTRTVSAVFTKDQAERRGHKICFQERNKEFVKARDPWRWKIVDPILPAPVTDSRTPT